jgi:DNA-binding transcriptional ArsR family regulator
MIDDSCSGVGFDFTDDDPYVGIDLDQVFDGVFFEDAALEIIKRFNTYAEASPSGTGVHIIFKADGVVLPFNRKGGVEIYNWGRFFAMTGDTIQGFSEIEDRADELEDWLSESLPTPEPTGPGRAAPAPGSARLVSGDGTDADLVSSCRRRWSKFGRLYDGDTVDYGHDHSRADQALVNYLVKAGVDDHDRIDRLFRGSGLMRDKWTRADYRALTIATALDGAVVPGISTLSDLDRCRRDLARAQESRQVAEAHASQNGEVLFHLARVLRNRKLRSARVVSALLAIKFSHFEARNERPPYPITITEIAEAAGIGRSAASKHVRSLEKAGVLRRHLRNVPAHVDLDTGEYTRPKQVTTLAPTGSALQFAESVAQLDLGTNWGGSRENGFGRSPHTGSIVLLPIPDSDAA